MTLQTQKVIPSSSKEEEIKKKISSMVKLLLFVLLVLPSAFYYGRDTQKQVSNKQDLCTFFTVLFFSSQTEIKQSAPLSVDYKKYQIKIMYNANYLDPVSNSKKDVKMKLSSNL